MNDQNNARPSWETPDQSYGYGPNQPGPYPAPATSPQPPRRKNRFGRVVVVVVGLCTLAIIGVVSCTALMFDGAIGATRDDVRPVISPPGPAVPTKEAPTTKPVEKSPPKGLRDGVLFVGKDVAPGTYTATVPDGAIGCYWARLKDTDGELESVIANHVSSVGQVSVTIKKTDYAVEVRCDGAKWTKR